MLIVLAWWGARPIGQTNISEFLDRVQAYAYCPYVVAKDVDNVTIVAQRTAPAGRKRSRG